MSLPVVDVSPLLDGTDPDSVATQIGAACRSYGFFYVSGHGVPSTVLDRLDAASRAFFELPEPEKLRIAMVHGGRAWRGFFPVGGELTSGRPDLKEGVYFGVELPADDPRVVARELKRGFRPFQILHDALMHRRSRELFGELKSETRPAQMVRRMSGGQRQAVAIARTRLSKAKVVLMDEPTAAISVRQVAEVLELLRRLRDQGIAVVLISHRMPDVFEVADRIVVLRRGHKVADKGIKGSSPEEVTGLITGAIRAA